MTMLTVLMAALALQGGAWTWTLYEGEGPVVLANEIPDTPDLKVTLECVPTSAVARLSLYGSQIGSGFANITSGPATATSQAENGTRESLVVPIRTDHPVFAAFVSSGSLTVAVGAQSQTVVVEPSHLAKLRRFTDVCNG